MKNAFFTVAYCAIFSFLFLSLTPKNSYAQDYKKIAPQSSYVPNTSAPKIVDKKDTSDESKKIIIPNLRGLVFVSSESEIKKDGLKPSNVGKSYINGIAAHVPDQAGFQKRLSSFIGRGVSFNDLQKITDITNDWYKNHNHPFISVNVPPQNISSGVIQVVVTEYKIGKVTVSGNHWFSKKIINWESNIRPGKVLTLSGLATDTDRLNSNAFRSVQTLFHPGKTVGTTDVTLQVDDRIPVHIYSEYDNQGTPLLGKQEWSVGGEYANLGGLDDTVSYQFTRDFSNRYIAHSLSFSLYLPWYDQIQIFGAYATERPYINEYFNEAGRSGQASGRYIHPFDDILFGSNFELKQSVEAGYDFKVTNNNLEFGGFQIFASLININQFPIGYNADLTDPYGETSLSDTLYFSPGNHFSRADTLINYENVVPGSNPRYIYDQGSLTRITYLPKNYSLTSSMYGQTTTSNLQYSEEMAIGGIGSVRGYLVNSAIGSKGFQMTQELKTPAFSILGLAKKKLKFIPFLDQTQFGVFYDYGHIKQATRIPNRVNQVDLASAGIDMHTTINRYFQATWDAGWQLRTPPSFIKRGVFTDVQITLGY